MLNGKVLIIPLRVELIKKMSLYKTSQYFPKRFEYSGGNTKVELNLSHYATETDSKGATSVDTSNVAAKSDWGNLKAEIDKINIDKLETAPVDLSKLSNVVDDVVKNYVW